MPAAQRFCFRIDDQNKQLIEQAAIMLGLNTFQFVVSTLVERALEVVDQHTNTRLTDRDRDVFLAALDADVQPNAALRATVTRYKNCQAGDISLSQFRQNCP